MSLNPTINPKKGTNISPEEWKKINANVYIFLKTLDPKYNNHVLQFLRWYQEHSNFDTNTTDEKFVKWIKSGVDPMRRMVIVANAAIAHIDKFWQALYTNKKIDRKVLYQKSKEYYQKIQIIYEALIEMLGCREKFTKWYVNLLSEVDPNNAYLNFFQQQCLNARNRVLNLKPLTP